MIRPSDLLLTLSIAVAGLFATSCSSPERYSNDRRHDGPAAHPVDMRGETIFFAGDLRVEATVTRGLPRRARGGEAGESRRSGGGHRRGGGGMERPSGGYGGDQGDEGQGRPMREPQMSAPPLTLAMKFANLSAHPIEVLIHDVKSDLGNFAVRPESLQIAPGQEAEVDPMVSQLGVVAAEIPVTIVLRSNGKTETQVLEVKDTLKTTQKE